MAAEKQVPAKLDISLDRISLFALVFLWMLTLIALIKLPSSVPIHFDAAGRPNSYGSKFTLLLLPLIALLAFLSINRLIKHPSIHHYPLRVSEKNSGSLLLLHTRMLRFLKLAVVLVLTMLILSGYFINDQNGLGSWFLPTVVFLFVLPTTYYVLQVLRHLK